MHLVSLRNVLRAAGRWASSDPEINDVFPHGPLSGFSGYDATQGADGLRYEKTGLYNLRLSLHLQESIPVPTIHLKGSAHRLKA